MATGLRTGLAAGGLVPQVPLKVGYDGTPIADMVRHPAGFSSFSGILDTDGAHANELSLPAESSGRFLLPALEGHNLVVLGMAITNADNETVKGRLWGLRPVRAFPAFGGHRAPNNAAQEFIGLYLGDLTFTAGDVGPNSSSKTWSESNVFFADTITASPDYTPSPGLQTVGGAGAPQIAYIDAFGCPYLLLQLSMGTAASACPLYGTL